jgi:hypothetical protein
MIVAVAVVVVVVEVEVIIEQGQVMIIIAGIIAVVTRITGL